MHEDWRAPGFSPAVQTIANSQASCFRLHRSKSLRHIRRTSIQSPRRVAQPSFSIKFRTPSAPAPRSGHKETPAAKISRKTKQKRLLRKLGDNLVLPLPSELNTIAAQCMITPRSPLAFVPHLLRTRSQSIVQPPSVDPATNTRHKLVLYHHLIRHPVVCHAFPFARRVHWQRRPSYHGTKRVYFRC